MAEYNEASQITVKGKEIHELLRYEGSATDLHQEVLSRLMARRKMSERSMSKRYDAWGQVDSMCRMHIDLSRKVKNADGSTGDKTEMPWARSIVVPMSYAIKQVFMTQLMGIYTRRDPPIEIVGAGPEDVKPAKLMNGVIAYDQIQTNYILELYTAIQDSLNYGMGGFIDCWEEKWGYKTIRAKPLIGKVLTMLGLPTSRREWNMKNEFQRVKAWDPYNTFPDPRVSLSDLQKGEFFFTCNWLGYLEILAGSMDNGGNYFNCEQVGRISPKAQAIKQRNKYGVSQMNLLGSMDEKDRGFHAVYSGIVVIIPRDWKLGDGDRPEKWHFTWVDDQIVIRAHPSEYDHDEINASAFESNIDTHVFGNPGAIENLDGLNRFMNWKYNSHVQNTMRHLNNRMLYSPALVEAVDVESPDAGMHIRLTSTGERLLQEGRLSMDQMIHQIQLQDVTGSMLRDLATDMDFAMRMSGAADQMMGRTTSEKRTLGEVQRVGHEGSARMAMYAMMMDVQGIRPTTLRWCSNRQQFTSEEMFVRITGDLARELKTDRYKIKPEDLQGNFDYVPKTGPEPPDPGQLAQAMANFTMQIGKQPGILTIPDQDGNLLDLHEMIKETLRHQGVKNPNDFYKKAGMGNGQPGQMPPGPQVSVLPDQQVQQMAQAGNIIPINAQRAA